MSPIYLLLNWQWPLEEQNYEYLLPIIPSLPSYELSLEQIFLFTTYKEINISNQFISEVLMIDIDINIIVIYIYI